MWQSKNKRIKLIQGDCLEVMDKLIEKGVKVDAIITDPPYGTTACKWDSVIPLDEMWNKLKLLRKDKTPIVLFGSEPFSSLLRTSNIKEFKYDWKWDKITGTGHLVAKYQPMQKIENISVFGKGRVAYYPQMIAISEDEYKRKISKISRKTYLSNSELTSSRKELSLEDRDLEKYKFKHPNNVLSYSKYIKECNNTHRLHPTQKPLELMEYLIKTYTNEGDIVLDFTMGSGTTGVACANLNRKFIGIELDEKYFDIAVNRIKGCE